MSQCSLVPIDQKHVNPLVISPRMRGQLVYFMAAPGAGMPALGENEYWFARRSPEVAGGRSILPGFAAGFGEHDRSRADRGTGSHAELAG